METVEQNKKRELDRETQDKVRFIAFIILQFSLAYKMSRPNAYLYLEKYGGMDYIYKYWKILNTYNTRWAIRDLYKICRNNGGLR